MSPEELRVFRSVGCKLLPEPVHCSVDVLKAKFLESKCADVFSQIRDAIKERRDDSLVMRIVDSDYLALIAGEYMLKYNIQSDFMLNFPEHIPYIFLTYTTVHNVFLGHFDLAFAKFAKFGILKVLLDSNMDQEHLKDAVLKCTGSVAGLEDSIMKHEKFREKGFLQKISHRISPMYPDVILSIYSVLSEYRFCLDAAQAYSILQASLRGGACRPDFVQYLVGKLGAAHVKKYQGVEETLIVLYSRYRIFPAHIVAELDNSIEKHYLLTCIKRFCCPHSCISSLHSCRCDSICVHLQAASRSAECINGFYFSLHERNYAASLIEGFLDQKTPSERLRCIVFREQVLCFMEYALAKRMLDVYFCRILRFKDRELTLKALIMLSQSTFFEKLKDIEELLPTHEKKIENGLMHVYRLIMSRCMHTTCEEGLFSENDVCGADRVYDLYLSMFVDYVIYKENIAVLLQVKSFDFSKHHHKMSEGLLEKYLENRGIDDGFIEVNFERYREVILKVLFRKKLTIQNYRVVVPCFRGVLRDLAFKCVVNKELFQITKDASAAMKAVLGEREVGIVFEYLRSMADFQGSSIKKKACDDVLPLFVEKYKHILQIEDCKEIFISTDAAESAEGILPAYSTEATDVGAAKAQKHERGEVRKCRGLARSKKQSATTNNTASQDAVDMFVHALESGAIEDKALESIAADGSRRKHEISFLISSMITKRKDVESMALVFSAFLSRLEPSVSTFHIRNILLHSREPAFAKKAQKFGAMLLCNIPAIETEVARLFIKNHQYVQSFDFLEHLFQKIGHSDIGECLAMLKHVLRKEMVPFICKGICCNAGLCLEDGSHISFLESTVTEFVKDDNELVKIIGLRVLRQSLFMKSRRQVCSGSSSSTVKSNAGDRDGPSAQHENIPGLGELGENKDFLDGITGLLGSNNDFVIIEVLDVLKDAAVFSDLLNCKVFDLLQRRARLDEVGKRCLGILNIEALQKTHLDRLFQMFYLDPLAFLGVVPRLRALGYELTREMITELVSLLTKVFSNDKREAICKALGDSIDSSHIDVILNAIAADNIYSQLVLISMLERVTSLVDMKMFLRLCLVIPTEKRLAIRALRVLENKQRAWTIPEKWMVDKLDMLMVWIYPLQMKDKNYYEQVCARVESKDPIMHAAVMDYYARGGFR